ncbi:MAG: M23 family metallopeptidase [Candidatus Omnitrophica bacterium]|nr:M23 family metallopeptidase [Candidatus Omnitrophota bacterium]
MKKLFYISVIILLLQPAVFLADWYIYRDKVPFLAPVAQKELQIRNDNYGNGHFGARRSGGRTHRGIDISAPLGIQVTASKGGRVITAYQKHGMGMYVIINHPKKLSTLYGHLSKVLVKNNAKVKQGEVIGLVGKTGNANYRQMKTHLHFEVRDDGEYLDPEDFLR